MNVISTILHGDLTSSFLGEGKQLEPERINKGPQMNSPTQKHYNSKQYRTFHPTDAGIIMGEDKLLQDETEKQHVPSPLSHLSGPSDHGTTTPNCPLYSIQSPTSYPLSMHIFIATLAYYIPSTASTNPMPVRTIKVSPALRQIVARRNAHKWLIQSQNDKEGTKKLTKIKQEYNKEIKVHKSQGSNLTNEEKSKMTKQSNHATREIQQKKIPYHSKEQTLSRLRQLKIHQRQHQKHRIGFDLDMNHSSLSNTEIAMELIFQGADLTRVHKLRTNHNLVSAAVLLEINSIPHYLFTLMAHSYLLQEYINKLWFCSNCKTWGHYASRCKFRKRCYACDDSYDNNCIFRGQRCVSYGGSQHPFSNKSPLTKKEKETVRIMREQSLTYAEATALTSLKCNRRGMKRLQIIQLTQYSTLPPKTRQQTTSFPYPQ
ncbi:hypothetical protein CHS0354_027864 [Potamilus streckersoni]|uniref:CCHC-type domain-containing protein n=1 Tax=Potamilus streckersoni TaxID=2493646 RepID=A0AAE0T0T4_9BIVA|nr:hypothetical protein CHS0354_027864 [Potamilus streckersoni]